MVNGIVGNDHQESIFYDAMDK
jgi:hypothetical protein